MDSHSNMSNVGERERDRERGLLPQLQLILVIATGPRLGRERGRDVGSLDTVVYSHTNVSNIGERERDR